MTKLIPQRAQANYIGLFSKPAFALYGSADKLWGGVFNIFDPYQVSLGDMQNASTSLNPSDQIITVYFGRGGDFKFKFDRIEVTAPGDQEFKSMPEILNRTDVWLRSAVPEFSFQTHLFSFASHNMLSEVTSQEFLLGFSEIDIPEIGTSEGTGLIFHWDIPDQHWRAQLTIDHSTVVPGGLFIQFLIRSESDKVDYITSMEKGEELFTKALSNIGLGDVGQSLNNGK
jgi:hypothetical protein